MNTDVKEKIAKSLNTYATDYEDYGMAEVAKKILDGEIKLVNVSDKSIYSFLEKIGIEEMVENGMISRNGVRDYLVKSRYNELSTNKRFSKNTICTILSEEFCLSWHSIVYILSDRYTKKNDLENFDKFVAVSK